jgi:hypothetical protein
MEMDILGQILVIDNTTFKLCSKKNFYKYKLSVLESPIFLPPIFITFWEKVDCHLTNVLATFFNANRPKNQDDLRK